MLQVFAPSNFRAGHQHRGRPGQQVIDRNPKSRKKRGLSPARIVEIRALLRRLAEHLF